MQHTDITYAEKFGSRWMENEPEFVGRCAYSRCTQKNICDDYEYMKDSFGNIFCSRECADLFYGLEVC